MAKAKEKADWGRASALLSLIANANRDAKKHKAFSPADFNPYAKGAERIQGDISALKVFVRK